jgi:hypothetical protein
VVAEMGVRFYEAVRAPRKASLGIDDPIRHHRWRAHGRGQIRGIPYETNSLGLRDREYAETKPTGAVRILMLGDSFTEGWTLEFENVVVKQVERSLARRCRQPYEVINAGNASYSPLLEYLLLKEIGPRLKPDLVLLNFDMTDVHDDFVRKTATGSLSPCRPTGGSRRRSSFLRSARRPCCGRSTPSTRL